MDRSEKLGPWVCKCGVASLTEEGWSRALAWSGTQAAPTCARIRHDLSQLSRLTFSCLAMCPDLGQAEQVASEASCSDQRSGLASGKSPDEWVRDFQGRR